jgi:Immunoglobulin-like domain of bacterial spore germination
VQRPHPTVSHAAAGLLAALLLAFAGCGGIHNEPGDATSGTRSSNAPIVLEQPVNGEKVSTPIHVEGTATVNEGAVSVVLTDGDGNELTTQTLQASCGTGCRGRFSGSIGVPAGFTGSAMLRLFETSAEDGSPLHEVDVPLTVG